MARYLLDSVIVIDHFNGDDGGGQVLGGQGQGNIAVFVSHIGVHSGLHQGDDDFGGQGDFHTGLGMRVVSGSGHGWKVVCSTMSRERERNGTWINRMDRI